MKKKIKNILKYISIPIIATLIFFISLSAQAETYFNNLLFNSIYNVEIITTTNETYTYGQINQVQVENINMFNSAYGYDAENDGKSVSYEKITLKQPLTINENNILIIEDYGMEPTFEFKLNGTIVKSINTTDVLGLLYYYLEETITFDRLDIKITNFDFVEDSPLICITDNQNVTSYQQGFIDGQAQQKPLLQEYQNELSTLRNNYNNLLIQYNQLATDEYTFESLFWSVGSVPMAFLLQSFNVNVLGLNIRAIITGLITALVVIWLVKKLLK